MPPSSPSSRCCWCCFTVVGIVLEGHRSLQDDIVNSALRQFPVIGSDLRNNVHQLSTGQRAGPDRRADLAGLRQHAAEPERPGDDGHGVGDRAGTSSRPSGTGSRGPSGSWPCWASGSSPGGRWPGSGAFGRLGASRPGSAWCCRWWSTSSCTGAGSPSWCGSREAEQAVWPGAIVGGVGWTVLQFTGAQLVSHQLRHLSNLYGTFATVLGLIWWIALGAMFTVYAAEFNVVLTRHLWPRSIPPGRRAGGRRSTGRRPRAVAEPSSGPTPGTSRSADGLSRHGHRRRGAARSSG